MSNLVKLLYEVEALGRRYNQVHESVCGFSARSILRSLRGKGEHDRGAQIAELQRILSQLETATNELLSLEEGAFSVRRSREIHRALLDYVSALSQTTCRLEALCQENQRDDERGLSFPRNPQNNLKIAYDDAVQNHRRLAERLNELVATL
jgi:hypothetical protein